MRRAYVASVNESTEKELQISTLRSWKQQKVEQVAASGRPLNIYEQISDEHFQISLFKDISAKLKDLTDK